MSDLTGNSQTATGEIRNPDGSNHADEGLQQFADDTNLPPFFGLSLDVLGVILEFLPFRDRIALSLTAKGLRHCFPKLQQQVYFHSPHKIDEELCARLVTRSILGPRTSQPEVAPAESTSTETVYECPYCLHPLCSPTECASALILDHGTGIFYPSHLYPVKTTKFWYFTQRPIFIYRGSEEMARDEAEEHGEWYSTIWCEHHRCPRDLLLNYRKYYGETNRFGAFRFLQQHEDGMRWSLVRALRGPFYTSTRTRWLIGHKKQYPLNLLAAAAGLKDTSWRSRPILWGKDLPTELEKNSWLEPVYEKFFYEMFCRHCLLPIPGPVRRERGEEDHPWGAKICRCKKTRKFGGCRRCGVLTVKITMVEVFDVFLKRHRRTYDDYGEEYDSEKGKEGCVKRSSYWLFLANDCQIVDHPSSGPDKQRLRYTNPLLAERRLRIVRGLDVFPIVRPRVGIQDLSYQTVMWIMTLHNLDRKDAEGHNDMLQSSYIFLKAYCGDVAASMARQAMDVSAYRDIANMCWPEARVVKEDDIVRVKMDTKMYIPSIA